MYREGQTRHATTLQHIESKTNTKLRKDDKRMSKEPPKRNDASTKRINTWLLRKQSETTLATQRVAEMEVSTGSYNN